MQIPFRIWVKCISMDVFIINILMNIFIYIPLHFYSFQQIIARVLLLNQSLEDATNEKRFHHMLYGNKLYLEKGFPEASTLMTTATHSLVVLFFLRVYKYKWASLRENLSSGIWEQHRRRSACVSAQSDQRLCYSLCGKYHM